MTYQEQLKKYCDDVIKGKILTGVYTKKAVQRFRSDLTRQKEPSFLYEYCPALADEVMSFAESLQIPDIQRDDGTKNMILQGWQIFVYCNIWGWRHKSDNSVRRFRTGYMECARKSGKTTGILFPWVLWDFLETDSAEAYFISADGLQSDKSYKELNYIIKADKDLAKNTSSTVNAITLNHSRIAFFSAESMAIDGYRNSLSIVDEFWNYQSDKVVTAFRYGGRARKNCLTFIITSAGNNVGSPCYAEALRCKKILNGAFDDETYWGCIWAIDDEDKWDDTSCYIKANPSLGVLVKLEILENDLADAQTMPSHKPDFLSKTCGIWTSAVSNWIPIQKWERNKNYIFNEEQLEGRDCCAAFDLSSVNDFTALTLYFQLDDGKYYPKHFFYIPSETVMERYKKENINILSWIQTGLVKAIEGGTIDQTVIFDDIIALSKKYHIKEIAYDRWQSSLLTEKISSEIDSVLIEYDQSLKSMGPATKRFEKAILDGAIVDNNPVMQWMLGNVRIQRDRNDNYKPLKEYASSGNRIDGVITSIMSFDRLVENTGKVVVTYDMNTFLASI
jgi:phage terminase large subunit-like protein